MISNSKTTLFFSDNTSAPCDILEPLGKSKYQVYKGSISGSGFAFKIFPFENSDFKREKSFTDIKHEFIVSPISTGFFEIEGVKKSFVQSHYCPHGTLSDIIVNKKVRFTEIVARTYFRQLCQAVKYLHDNKVAHLDIKLTNIMIDEKFNLRLGDFDIAHRDVMPNNPMGSKDFRAPEMYEDPDYDQYQADIFILAIVLFTMHNGKTTPFMEKHPDVYKMKERNAEKYWTYLRDKLVKEDIWTEDFKDLFEWMTSKNPKARPNIDEVMLCDWYNGEIFEQEELENFMKKAIGL